VTLQNRLFWHESGMAGMGSVGENYSDSGQAVLELPNRFGADDWELAGLQDYREGGGGSPMREDGKIRQS
jgi:hypothetical protein